MTKHFGRMIIILALMLSNAIPVVAQPVGGDPVRDLMARMAPKMRVGQLVMVSFPGSDVGASSDIAALIRDYAIGGVLLSPHHGNFGILPAHPGAMQALNNELQALSWEASTRWLESPDEVSPLQTAFVPLLIAVPSQVADEPITTYISGTSRLPVSLALGATWSPDLAYETGRIYGKELTALGFNTFFGPHLDVLYNPQPNSRADLGANVLGGDPFWVGELGRAYVRGLRSGSNGAMAIIPGHFPGLGDADRAIQDEVPTIQRSLSQLRQIDLAPFFDVAGKNLDSTADGFLVTHIRYRGFQGNIRLSTRPISLDAQALQQVLALDELSPWRANGGLLVADNLGYRSIRRFYDPTETSFNTRRVVQDALAAGNDLLILDRFALQGDWTQHFVNIRDVLDYLLQRYEADPVFKEQVDTALYRILSLKLRLYPRPTLAAVQHTPQELSLLGQAGNLNARVAQSALTRLAPLAEDQRPPAPTTGARIVIFTQERFIPPEETWLQPPETFGTFWFANTLLRLYGPEGTGQLRLNSITAYSFADLQRLIELDNAPETLRILESVQRADWVLFLARGYTSSDPYAMTLQRFLDERVDLLKGRVVLFAFGPPYELDATQISKLDLFYVLYYAGPLFAEVAARALFGDVAPVGASPVSIPGLNYDLSTVVLPNPDQVIPLKLVDRNGNVLTTTEGVRKGDVMYLQAGPILDSNDHIIPDGTPVQFLLLYVQEGVERTLNVESVGGMATASITLDREGQLDIIAQSEGALRSFTVRLTIPPNEPVIPQIIMPTPQPEPQVTPEPSPSEKPRPLPGVLRPLWPRRWPLLMWGLGTSIILALTVWSAARRRHLHPAPAMRLALLVASAGILSYTIAVALGRWVWPLAMYRLAGHEAWMALLPIGSGGGVVAIGWRLRRDQQRRHQTASQYKP